MQFDPWMVAVVALVAFVLGRMTAKDPMQRDRERKEREAATRRSRAAMDRDLRGEIYEMLRQRRKIDAIKLVRQRLQIGLKEAKDVVEDMEAAGRD